MVVRQKLPSDPSEELARLRTRVAELEHTETRLAESEQRFRELFSHSPIGLMVYDAEGRLTDANNACLTMFGIVDATSVKGFRLFEGPNVPEKMKETLRKGQPARHEFDLDLSKVKALNLYPTTKSGVVRLDLLVTPILRQAAGRPAGYLAQVQDVTEHRASDNALGESEEMLHAIFDKAAIGIAQVDIEGHIWETNPAFREMIGYTAAELRGRSVFEFTHPGDKIGDEEEFRELVAGRRAALRVEKRIIRKDGRTISVSVIPSVCRDAAGKPQFIIAMLEDITARKQAEESLRNAYGELERRVRDRTGELAKANEGLQAEIAERRRAEQALRENEETIRALLNATTDVVALLDAQATVLALNEATALRWGKKLDQVLGHSVYQFLAPDVARARKLRFDQAVRSGVPDRFEDEHRSLWWDSRVYPIRDAEGKVVRLAVYSSDITARKEMEKALRESETRFRTAFENGAIGMALVAPDGRTLQANSAFCRMVGYTEAELVNHRFAEITHPDDLPLNLPNWQMMIRGETPSFRMEKRYIRKDGSVLWGDMSTTAVRDANGRALYQISHIQDITERKRAEEALRESEERYRALFEDAPVAVVEFDCSRLMEYLNQLKQQGVANVREYVEAHPEEADRCFATLIPLDANRAAVKLLKAEDRSHLLRSIASTLCDETRKYFRTSVALLAGGGTTLEGETALRTLTGEKREVWMSASFTPGRAGFSPRAVIATADFTELRAAERELVRQREAVQLQRMETLAATGRLAAGVAHEINNPLQGIVAQLELLALELPADLRKSRRIELINGAILKIANIVSNLLRLHRPPQEAEKSCSASSVIGNVTELISPQAASRRIKVEVAVKPPEATIPLSANALTQVLLNLLLNAVDAMPAGGVIRIEASQTAEETLLLVSDTGTGIPPEHRNGLFSPFFTTKGPAGTGLGLSVTHALVTAAGGTIDAADRKGGGATFFIRFPASRPEA